MLRRIIVLLVATFALGAAQHPQPTAKGEQHQATDIQQGSARIAKAIHDVRPNEDKGCEAGENKRGSDLCAQWKAADAAKSAAIATWAAVLFSFVGTALIAATFAHGWKTSRRELRAYIHLQSGTLIKCKDQNFPTESSSDEQRFLRLKFQNYGATPAKKVRCEFRTLIADFPLVDELTDFPIDKTHNSVSDLPPGRENAIDIEINGSGVSMPAILEGKIAIYVYGRIDYEDIFGCAHVTNVRLVSRTLDFRGNRFRPMDTGNDCD